MKTYHLDLKSLPFNNDYDVIVVGGGPAGCTAAIAAAREGAKTLLVEGTNALGGMGTMGLVPNWCPFSNRETIVYRGLAEKVFILAKQGMPHIDPSSLDWVAIDPEHLKSVYDQLMNEYGVTVLFQTFLSSVQTDNNQLIDAIILSNKAGLTAFQAKVYIDATGDADLVGFAGGEFVVGSSPLEEVQAATHCFMLSNVDEKAFINGPWLNRANHLSPAYQIKDSLKYPLVNDPHMCAKIIGHGTVGFNAGHVPSINVLDPFELSKTFMIGRKLAKEVHEGLKEYHPLAFQNSFLANTASLLGIRESRRIVGDYVLTLEDYVSRRSFSDEVFRNNYFLDIHPSKNDIPTDILSDSHKKQLPYKKGESHGVPYRCLIPVSFKNVLVAGRSISVERLVQGSIRVMPSALAMGEAAGMAAGMAVKVNGLVRSINVIELRQKLIDAGAYIK